MKPNPIMGLMTSRKFLVCMLATAATTVLCALGKISPDKWVEITGALVAVLMLAIAGEDHGKHRGVSAKSEMTMVLKPHEDMLAVVEDKDEEKKE